MSTRTTKLYSIPLHTFGHLEFPREEPERIVTILDYLRGQGEDIPDIDEIALWEVNHDLKTNDVRILLRLTEEVQNNG